MYGVFRASQVWDMLDSIKTSEMVFGNFFDIKRGVIFDKFFDLL